MLVATLGIQYKLLFLNKLLVFIGQEAHSFVNAPYICRKYVIHVNFHYVFENKIKFKYIIVLTVFII